MSDPAFQASVVPLLPVGPIRRVIVCGSRDWADGHVIEVALSTIASLQHTPVEIIHGGARGADRLAGQCASKLGLKERAELADWVGRGRGAGFERNARMLALSPSPNLVLAFKDSFDYTLRRGGTEHMCRIALATNPPTPVLLYSTAHGWERVLSVR